MIPRCLTEGMSTIEVLVVLMAANASQPEVERLRDFFIEWATSRPSAPIPASVPA